MLASLLRRDTRIRDRYAAALALVLVVIVASATRAQPTQSPDQATPPVSDEPPSDKPGLMNELGKLLKSPADLLPSLSKPASEIPPAPNPQPSVEKKAAEPQPAPPPVSPSSQFFPGFVGGREVCPRSPDGAPDCQAGADRLCQSKGYKSGKSLNIDAAFTCSAKRAPGRKLCGNESFVTRAFCQ